MLTLEVKKRDLLGKASKNLVKSGDMPAVLYGPKQESTPITIPVRTFKKLWKQGGESSVVVLTGLGDEKEALIHEVDFDPVTDEPRHADFYVIEKGKKVTVGVPIEFIGVAPAVKELGGVLVKVLHELELEVMPKDLPQSIEVDTASLVSFDSQILVKDVKVPSSATVLNNPDDVVALVQEVKEEVVEAAPMDLSAIEVEKKGKEEVAEEAGDGKAE
jgi:large subunit ribosomal protein L25